MAKIEKKNSSTIESLFNKLKDQLEKHQSNLSNSKRILDPNDNDIFDFIEGAKIDEHFKYFYIIKNLACKQFYNEILTYYTPSIENLEKVSDMMLNRFRNDWDLKQLKPLYKTKYENAFDIEYDREFLHALLMFKRDLSNLKANFEELEKREKDLKKLQESQIKMQLT